MDGKNIALVFTMGFTIDNMVKTITNRGIKGDEHVILLSVIPTDQLSKMRSDETIKSATSYLSSLGLKHFEKYININTSLETIVSQIHDVLREYDEIELYIIGGMRILGLASYYYSILISPFKKVKVVASTENMSNTYELLTKTPVIPESKEIIELMFELREPKEIREVAYNLNKTVSTISKQISKISDLVECTDTRPKICKLNEIGRILLDEIVSSKRRG